MDFENSKKLLAEHIVNLNGLKQLDDSSDINLCNILCTDTQSVLNNFDIIHYNYLHSLHSKKSYDYQYSTEYITSFYDVYLSLPYGVETKYESPKFNWDSIKNSIVKIKSDEEIEEIVKKYLENLESSNNKIALIDTDYMVLSQFKGIPHLLFPIVTEENQIDCILKNVNSLIEERFNNFLDTRTKNIVAYNDYVEKYNESHPKTQIEKMSNLLFFITDICSLSNNNNFKDNLMKIILKSEKVGIKFILMTKLSASKVNLGIATDFFEKYSNADIKKIYSLSNDIKEKEYEFDENMDGFEFENFAKVLLEANGFDNVEVTTASHDFGVDVIAYKDNVKYAIQCKKYSSKVGIKAVQEVIGSKSMHKCHVGVVLTNNFFTKSAIELAEKNNIFLWDGNKLNDLIKKYNENSMEIL